MAAIKPTRFSTSLALKVFDPLDEEEEQGEDDDRHADVQQIPHHNSLE
jgi:hypothetical protein